VGASGRLHERWARHRLLLRAGRHPEQSLQHEWREYGPDAFEFRVLERVPRVQAKSREIAWMRALDARGKLANRFSPECFSS